MANLEGLYDMVGFKPEKEDVFEEQRFRKAIENTKVSRNKDMFDENKECFTKCIRYNPCPICDKCQSKASHLYVKCQLCEIPICTHKYKDRQYMIRRNNFKITASKETIDKLNSLSKQVKGE